jgi:uncharacterized membrane protein YhaH (DUF805 family)
MKKLYNGRLSRLQHFYALLLLFIGGYAVFFVTTWILAWLFELFNFPPNVTDFVVVLLFFVFILFLIIETLFIHTRRLHDQGRSGGNLIYMIVPIMNLILLYWIWIAPGNRKEKNEYGQIQPTTIRNLLGISN